MSHLFKIKYQKNIYKIFKLLVIISILIIFFQSLLNYQGNKFNYITFSLLFNYLIIFAFRKNATFLEIFFSIFLWLGFWFKLSFSISFFSIIYFEKNFSISLIEDGMFLNAVGDFNYSPESFDKALIISQIAGLSFILSGIFREKFIFNYPKKITFLNEDFNYFIKLRKFLWAFFFLFVIFTIFLNVKLQIYQRGLIPNINIFLISGIVKWLLLFGLTSFGSLIIFFEITKIKKISTIAPIFIFLETFFSSISMLSRGMIFNSLAVLYGIYKFSKKIKSYNNFKYYLKFIIIIFILFYISVLSVNTLRDKYFYKGDSVYFSEQKVISINKNSNEITKELLKQNYEFLYLLIQRWVGIDAVMAVLSRQEKLSYEFFLKSFNEKYNPRGLSFYEENFNIKIIDPLAQPSKNVKGNTLPGIIAFLYLSGSYIFVFISLFFILNLLNLIEYAAFKLSSKNVIFSAVIGQVIAYRLIHFGYMPSNSFMLFGALILNIFLVFILLKFLKKKFK